MNKQPLDDKISVNEKITLVGGGLVGSLLAINFAQRGFQVDVYESRPDMRKTQISAGRSINLALANRGIEPLKKVGIMEKVWPLLIPMKGRLIHHTDESTQFFPYGQKSHEVVYSVSRGELNKLLMDEAEVTGKVEFHFNQACQSINYEDKCMTVHALDSGKSSTISFDRLIGTDGGGSIVRKSLLAQLTTESINIEDREEMLGHSYKELTIEPSADGTFKIEKEALHIWPRGGYMLIALPNTDGSFTVTLFLPNEGENSFESLNTKEKVESFFSQQFPDALTLMPNLSTAFFENPTGHLGTVKCAPWFYKNKALLLGDAAHAVVPFHGQGMNCGFEDCMVMMDLLDGLENNNWTEWLQATFEVRKPNSDAIADLALENYIEMRQSVADAKFQEKKAMAFERERQFNGFIPRYSMVMFHLMPYAEAKRLGVIQQSILDTLYDEGSRPGAIDLNRAETLIKTHYH